MFGLFGFLVLELFLENATNEPQPKIQTNQTYLFQNMQKHMRKAKKKKKNKVSATMCPGIMLQKVGCWGLVSLHLVCNIGLFVCVFIVLARNCAGCRRDAPLRGFLVWQWHSLRFRISSVSELVGELVRELVEELVIELRQLIASFCY